MKVRLDLIKSSPHHIQTSWDRKKMENLVQFIEELGLIVSIKIRPIQEIVEIACQKHGLSVLDEMTWGGFLLTILEECAECCALANAVWGTSDLFLLDEDEETRRFYGIISPLLVPFEVIGGGYHWVETLLKKPRSPASPGWVECVLDSV